jgi:spoIIIJ-associated protein
MESEIRKTIEEFLNKTSFGFEEISGGLDMDSGDFWFSVKSSDSNFLIGRNGETIQNINYIIRRIMENKFKENAPRVTIDVNDYQKAKIEKVRTIAHMMAERARFFKSKVELEPMNAFERRIVHEYVSKHSDLKSESEGFGKNRRVAISFVK